MLVHEWMTQNVITVTADTSMMKASRLMKEKRIGRLPVVDESNHIVGMVSDRDIKDASPSKATTLDTHELYYLLSEMKVKDIMTRNPVCVKKNDSVERTAILMTQGRFGGVPVVNDDNTVCGIITDNDIFKLLISITGIKIGGIQLAFDVPSEPNTLRPILDALRELEAGGSFLGTHPIEAHVGLGIGQVTGIRVRWPDGSDEQFRPSVATTQLLERGNGYDLFIDEFE